MTFAKKLLRSTVVNLTRSICLTLTHHHDLSFVKLLSPKVTIHPKSSHLSLHFITRTTAHCKHSSKQLVVLMETILISL